MCDWWQWWCLLWWNTGKDTNSDFKWTTGKLICMCNEEFHESDLTVAVNKVSEVCFGSVTSDGFHCLFSRVLPSQLNQAVHVIISEDWSRNKQGSEDHTDTNRRHLCQWVFISSGWVRQSGPGEMRKRPLQLEKESLPSSLLQGSERVVTYEGDFKEIINHRY